MNNKLTVLINSLGRSRTIEDTLVSVISQRTPFDQIIISIFDCDYESKEKCLKFVEKHPGLGIELINDKALHAGCSDWNVGVDLIRCEYAIVLEGDDVLDSDFVESFKNVENTSDGKYSLYIAGKKNKIISSKNLSIYDMYSRVLSDTEVPAPSQTIFKVPSLELNNQLFNVKEFGYAPEYDLWIRVLSNNNSAIRLASKVHRRISVSPELRTSEIDDRIKIFIKYHDKMTLWVKLRFLLNSGLLLTRRYIIFSIKKRKIQKGYELSFFIFLRTVLGVLLR